MHGAVMNVMLLDTKQKNAGPEMGSYVACRRTSRVSLIKHSPNGNQEELVYTPVSFLSGRQARASFSIAEHI